jgi:hypothetical protein
MKCIRYLFLAGAFIGLIACIEDTVMLDNLSKDIAIERELPAPLVKTEFIFDDIAGHGYDSLIIQSGDTIFLYLVEDLGFRDTMELSEVGDEMEFEFVNLHYTITNMFPIGLDLQFYLYDSLMAQNIDTIWFSDIPGQLFLVPAPVDMNGLVIEDQVQTENSYIGLDAPVIDNLFHGATHIVINAVVPSTGSYVKILEHYRLAIQLGVHFKGQYVSSLDSIN